jgi:sugar phosphate isomerase/epimerase
LQIIAEHQQPYRFLSYTTSGSPKMAPISSASVQKVPLAYASCSIGCRPSDTLPRKLEALSKAGFTSIELSFPDILDYAALLQSQPISSDNFSELALVAHRIRELCKANSLTIMMLQPFANFEGWPKGSPERKDAFARARGWIQIMEALGTDLLQVCNHPRRNINYNLTISSGRSY